MYHAHYITNKYNDTISLYITEGHGLDITMYKVITLVNYI